MSLPERVPELGENVVDIGSARKEGKEGRKVARKLPTSRRRSDDFNAIVGPLERAQGQVMYGDGLAACLAAFDEDAEGLAICAATVIDEWLHGSDIRKPLGVFCKRVEKGQHRRPAGDDQTTTEGGRDGTVPRAAGEYD